MKLLEFSLYSSLIHLPNKYLFVNCAGSLVSKDEKDKYIPFLPLE